MSSAADHYAFEHSVQSTNDDAVFSAKKWTYIQDSTSNNGQYQGQIQFNLSTISSQAAFVNWEEAVIELPIKLQILNGGTAFEPAAAPTVDQLVPKAGAWHFIDSVQVVIDGVTVQTNCDAVRVRFSGCSMVVCAARVGCNQLQPEKAMERGRNHPRSD